MAYHEDLINESFFYFLKAIETYDPEISLFTTHLGWQIRPAFRKIIQGYAKKSDPLNNCLSIDVPISEDEDLLLSDTLTDTSAENDMKALELAEHNNGIKIFLSEAFSHIKSPEGLSIIQYMLANNCGLTQAIRNLYGQENTKENTYIGKYRSALSNIRIFALRNKSKMLFWDIDDYISYSGTLSSFKNNQFTSSVELSVLKKELREETL